jgi:hypothetical protein
MTCASIFYLVFLYLFRFYQTNTFSDLYEQLDGDCREISVTWCWRPCWRNYICRALCIRTIQHLKSVAGTQSLSSDPSDSRDSRNDVTLRAIKYMEIVHKKVLKDFSYPEMEKQKTENEILRRHWIEDEKLPQIYKKPKQVTRSWDGLIDDICSSNQRIQKIISRNYSAQHDMRNTVFLEIQTTTLAIDQLGMWIYSHAQGNRAYIHTIVNLMLPQMSTPLGSMDRI